MLVLSDNDVRACVPMALAIEVNAAAFASMEGGTAEVPGRSILTTKMGPTLFKPACIPSADDLEAPEALGLKVVSVRAANQGLGLPTVPATVFMFDATTGLPSAVVAATWLTALRTAAGSGVATRALAPVSPRTLVCFGAGMQAEAHISAMLCVRPSITTVVVINRSLPRAEALAATLPTLSTEALTLGDTADVERVVRAADIICATTNSSTPLWDGAWLKPGTHVNAIGSYTPQMQEVDAATMERCTIIVDEPGAALSGDIAIPLAAGRISAEVNGLATLGSVLLASGATPVGGGGGGQAGASSLDCTLFKSVGVAVQDVATGAMAVTKAKELGLGMKVA